MQLRHTGRVVIQRGRVVSLRSERVALAGGSSALPLNTGHLRRGIVEGAEREDRGGEQQELESPLPGTTSG